MIDSVDSSNIIIEEEEEKEKKDSSDKSQNGNVFEWRNVSVSLEKKRSLFKSIKSQSAQRIKLLSKAEGKVRSGELCAIIGPEGSGKSLLLNTLSQTSNKNLHVTGEIMYNDKFDYSSDKTCYVQDDFVFYEKYTVEEHLKFYIGLMKSNKLTKKEQSKLVKELINRFNLANCQFARIGSDTANSSGISRGERKRLIIATSVIKNPEIIFYDDPTMGLDHIESDEVVKILRNLADDNKIVICTMNQVSTKALQMFNKLVLLHNGECIGYGTIDEISNCFENCDCPCSKYFNLHDHVIHTFQVEADEDTHDNSNKSKRHHMEILRDKFQNSLLPNQNKNIPPEHKITNDIIKKKTRKVGFSYGSSIFQQMKYLLARNFVIIGRNKIGLFSKIIQHILAAIMLGTVFFKLQVRASTAIEFFGLIGFYLIYITVEIVLSSLFSYQKGLKLFEYEHKQQLYSSYIYYMCQIFVELLINIPMVLLFTAISYFLTGFRAAPEAFFATYGILLLINQSSISLSYIISIVTKSAEKTLFLCVAIILALLVVAGILLKTKDIPNYVIWIEYASWFKYGFESLSAIQLRRREIKCDDPIICGRFVGIEITGEFVMNIIDLKPSNFIRDAGALCGILLVLKLLGGFLLFLNGYLAKRH